MTGKLVGGDTFPELTLDIAGDGQLALPNDIDTPFAILLFYRGHW